MLEPILDNKTKEKILLVLCVSKEMYAREIAAIFKINLYSVQRQLRKLERGGVLVSRLKGRTRLFSFNPRYPFINELKKLLARALLFVPKKEREEFYTPRLRPRRSGKPL